MAVAKQSSGPIVEAPSGEKMVVERSRLLPDPRVLLDIFRRRFLIFAAIAGTILAACAAYAALAPRTYESVASVLIEPRRPDLIQPVPGEAERPRSSEFIETQIIILKSPELARRVAQSLNLAANQRFATAGTAQARLDAAAAAARSAITVRRAGTTAVVEIVAETDSPELSAELANAFAQQYLLDIAAGVTATEERENAQVNERLNALRIAAERADAALQRYSIQHGLMSAEGATMAEQESSTLNQQVAQARADLAERQGRLNAARGQLAGGGGGADVSSALNSGTIGGLRQQEAEGSRTMAQLRTRYGPRHPAVAQEEERLADIRKQIQLEIDRIMSSLQGEVAVASSRLASLLASQSQAGGRLAGNAAAQVGYLELQRKAEAARTIYSAFLNRSQGAAARTGIDAPMASISAAALPSAVPASPDVRLIYLLGSLFALVGGLTGVAVAEFLDRGIRSRQDVEGRLGARYLGAVPDVASTLSGMRLTEKPEDYVVSHPLSSFAESLRNLRAAVTLRGSHRSRVIALASALPGEGKSTTAISLARVTALSGTPTVLVDCDIRRHSASNVLLDGRPGGLFAALSGQAAASLLVEDRLTPLKVLGISEDATDGVQPLSVESLRRVLDELRQSFDCIILDTAPVLGVADARDAARSADATVLLARWRDTSLRAVDTAIDLLVNAEVNLAGVALTVVNVKKFGSETEDLYGYHKKFKGYYQN